MKSLRTQLKNDLKELFSNDSTHPEYEDIIVKDKYEKYPEITYPMITIDELNNENVEQYFNDSGEQVSYLSYQIRIDCEQTEEHTAWENVDIIGNMIDDYMGGKRYYCLRRIGNFPKYPMQNDDNVIVGYLRYEGNLDINTNIIYRR